MYRQVPSLCMDCTKSLESREQSNDSPLHRNYEDVYTDPGSPISRRTAMGTYVLAKLDGERKLLLSGGGASPDGNKPFLDVSQYHSCFMQTDNALGARLDVLLQCI